MHTTLFARAVTLLAVGAGTVLLAACGPTPSSAASHHGSGASKTVWLCRPGSSLDPCATSLTTTVVAADGQRTLDTVTAPRHPAFDCFYVYPTVSSEPTTNANLVIQRAEISAAKTQAAPFSQVCRVFAPMYRQVTLQGLLKGLGADAAADRDAYESLLSGWTDYLRHYNDGRPVVFIGHSQGAAMLIRLLEHEVDPSPGLRGRMVSAILLGGNVAVPDGKVLGATFSHLPLCVTPTATGCVIAYSSFPSAPPADSLFGRPGQGVSLQSGQTATAGVQVACVNPADLGGGVGPLVPWFRANTQALAPPKVSTPWVSYPGLYTAGCQSAGGATWLQVSDVATSGDARPVVAETLGPEWGFHLYDVNLAMQNLVNDVQTEERAYAASHS